MEIYTLYDPKTGKQFCDAKMTGNQADFKNDDLRSKGRSQRWLLKENVPATADRSLIGLGVWDQQKAAAE